MYACTYVCVYVFCRSFRVREGHLLESLSLSLSLSPSISLSLHLSISLSLYLSTSIYLSLYHSISLPTPVTM